MTPITDKLIWTENSCIGYPLSRLLNLCIHCGHFIFLLNPVFRIIHVEFRPIRLFSLITIKNFKISRLLIGSSVSKIETHEFYFLSWILLQGRDQALISIFTIQKLSALITQLSIVSDLRERFITGSGFKNVIPKYLVLHIFKCVKLKK